MDNFEWNAGYLMKFGLYYWDKANTGNRNRTLKPGGRLMAKIYKGMPDDIGKIRDYCQVSIAL
jgi:beta-glucosidase/6-phospho-beta-glucosidase/beta-galactosidase